jgi:phosphatidylethanolamine/phosphatidyl-N-methylethanolamine N-methyltransferase
MALFDREPSVDEHLVSGSDAATRTLSGVAVENHFVEGVYEKLANFYDFFFGPPLHVGRLRAIERMGIQPADRILEVGVGTGINTDLYPADCHVIGIDFSIPMLEKARARVARNALRHVRLLHMDAARMHFADESFDIVYAPYLINVVPDPVTVAREMSRVCRVGGRVVFLNHFLSSNPIMSRIERWMSPLTVHIGFKTDLDLKAFLTQAELNAVSIEKVNFANLWEVVICVKPVTQ